MVGQGIQRAYDIYRVIPRACVLEILLGRSLAASRSIKLFLLDQENGIMDEIGDYMIWRIYIEYPARRLLSQLSILKMLAIIMWLAWLFVKSTSRKCMIAQ